jgi:alpha-glucosidase
MQWNNNKHAGFTSFEPWLPIANDFDVINVEKEKEDPKSFLSLYKKLIELRKNYLALSLGVYKPLNVDNDSCFVFTRSYEFSEFLIALNFTNDIQTLKIDNDKEKKMVLSTYLDKKGIIGDYSFDLRANEGCFFKLE